MRNKYLTNLEKIEFVVTYACTGRCKHCSEGEHTSCGEHIAPESAADAVRKVAAEYDIKTVMTFGGEPLLYPEVVYAVMGAARECNIPRRQVITNGYFSNDPNRIAGLASRLFECGVNDLIVSVDAFHQETIPLMVVRTFISEAIRLGIPTRLQPAWLVCREDDNPYNQKTRELLLTFADLGAPVSEGNVVFPEGNALKYLGEYFAANRPENPYTEDQCNVKCVSFDPNGDVLGGNVYENDVLDILKNYEPIKGINL
jgi:hypothetical protein